MQNRAPPAACWANFIVLRRFVDAAFALEGRRGRGGGRVDGANDGGTATLMLPPDPRTKNWLPPGLRALRPPARVLVLVLVLGALVLLPAPWVPTPLLHTTTREESTRRSRPLGVTSSTQRRSWERSAVTNGTGPE
jgi:hypothetical protein